MKAFTFQIDDDRPGVDSVVTVTVADAERAFMLAEKMIAENRNYLGVAVYEDGAKIYAAGSMADPTGAAP